MTLASTPTIVQPVQGATWGQSVANLFPGYVAQQEALQGIAQSQAQTRDISAQAAQREQDLANQKQQAQILQRLAQQRMAVQNGMDAQIQNLIEQGTALIAGGQPAAGADLLEKASLVQSHMATVKREQDTQEQQQFTRNEKLLADADEMWAGINSQADMDAAAVNWAEGHRGAPNPFAGQMYSPALIEYHRNTSKAGLAYLKEQQAAKAAEDTHKYREKATQFFDARTTYLNKIAQLREAAANRAKKTGGTVPQAPPALRAEAEHSIEDKYPDLSAREVENLGFDIGNRAMEIVKANPGVGQAQALDQALEETERSQRIKTVNENYKLFGRELPFSRKRTVVVKEHEDYPSGRVASGRIVRDGQKAAPGTLKAPLSLPASKDASELQEGKIYTDSKGNMRVWTAGGWVPLDEAGVDEETGEAVLPEDTE